jgi:hypothetical protein
MEKLFHFDSEREVYRADAFVISCFDARFETAVRKFLRRHGAKPYDLVRIPGGARALAAPVEDGEREFALRMLRTSIALHNPRRAVLIGHADCGAYGGVDPGVVIEDLRRAGTVLADAEPSLPVELLFADFDGVYRV